MENYKRILDYAKVNYKRMFREPVGTLKHKFIVPGACYDNCLWDWDSWLTDIALRQFVDIDISEYEQGCVLNFLDNIDEDGRIPIVICSTSEAPFFKKEERTNIHKPCLAQHAAFIIKNNSDNAEWIRPYFSALEKFIMYYYNNCRHENGLYYWIDDCAIGVDNDPSTFYRPKCSSASIYLNCFMFKEYDALCYIGELLGCDMAFYAAERENLKSAIQNNCYDEKDGNYYSVDLNLLPVLNDNGLHCGAPRHWDCLIQRIGCWSSFLPMWCGIATVEQAERMVKENLLDEKAFWSPYGVRSLSKYEKMYTIKASGNPSCWLGPIWGISNYLVFRGLVKYGFESEAKELAEILQAYYKKASEIEIPIKADSQAENEKEILIGATNRAESSGDISESDIEVSLKNKKLVFKGGHNVTLKSAVEKFVRLKPENKQVFTYKISTDFKSTALDNYTYVWGDEFEGSDLDFTKWDFEDRMGSTTKIETAWDKEVINVEDGRLKLHAINYFDPMREGTMYKVPYSVVTKYKMNYTYGYVEIRARVPLYKGSWPSFWGLSLNGQGGTYSDKGLMYNKAKSDKKLYGVEVDIFEVFGSKAITPNVHKWYRANNYAYDEIHNVQTGNHTELTSKEVWDWAVKSENPDNASNEYHTYGFEWTSKEMSFYVDGNKYYTLDITKSYDLCEDMSGFHDAIYLMFNNHAFADDQSWYQNLIEDHTQMPFCFYIDYIRLYQQKNVGRLTIDETPKEYSGR